MKRRVILSFLLILAGVAAGFPAGAQDPSHEQEVRAFRNALKQLPYTEARTAQTPMTAKGVGMEAGSVVMQIEFEKGRFDIADEQRRTVRALGEAIAWDPFLKDSVFVVEGHTCNLGSAASNEILARKRAEAVVDLLQNQFGLPADQFRIVSYGESRPLNANRNEEERRQNRRVVIRNTFQNVKLGAVLKTVDETGGVVTVDELVTLKPGQKYALEISPREELYTYAFQISQNGDVVQLFPNPKMAPGENPLKPSNVYRVPPFGRWFTPTGSPGEETLMVIGSNRPLADPMDQSCRLAGYAAGWSWETGGSSRSIGGVGTSAQKGEAVKAQRLRGRCGGASRGIGGTAPIQAALPESSSGAIVAAPADQGEEATLPQDITVWVRVFRHM